MNIFDSSDRPTNPKRYWYLQRKLGGGGGQEGRILPPNILIAFDGKRHLQLEGDCLSHLIDPQL